MSFTRLSLLAQSTYSRLVDSLIASATGDVTAGVTLVEKQIRGRTYWYAQTTVDGEKRQTYLGPSSPELDARIAAWRNAKAEEKSRAELVAMARAGGAHVITGAETRVFEQLASVFRVGAVLVGSHAFGVIGNSLGVRWNEASVDLAHDPRIAVAVLKKSPLSNNDDLVPRFDVLNPTAPATSFQVRGTDIQVDLLTPLVGRERSGPIVIPALNAAATPLRFLDFLIEESQPGAVVGGKGVLVNVPRPGRYAIHKLIVASRRHTSTTGPSKAGKDRAQAAALLDVLLSDLPGEITLAWKALLARGKGWVTAARTSISQLDPNLIMRLRRVGITHGPKVGETRKTSRSDDRQD